MADEQLPEVCLRAARLRKALDEQIMGRGTHEVDQRSGEGGRRVRFQALSDAQLRALQREVYAAERACAAARGLPLPRIRSAIGSTTMRRV